MKQAMRWMAIEACGLIRQLRPSTRQSADIDTELLHPRNEGRSFQSHTGGSTVRSPYTAFGLSEDLHDLFTFIGVAEVERFECSARDRYIKRGVLGRSTA